ncbi:hypothetical protein O6H91_02G093200 [Diphasiastrum complanatum]|uniref:Uncharacterized protein n=1 Tax=Diphasiastrum complanatum TaxID=34168 RepID=A0ACC2EIC7_DIPCM|nr:hypothetical protein O6H91_02G093200 [Diphasiastrum complanatum]
MVCLSWRDFSPFPPHKDGCFISGQELSDLCAIGEDILLSDVSDSTRTSKPFAGFGSYRHVHGELVIKNRGSSKSRPGLSSEAPAKLGSDCSHVTDAAKSSQLLEVLHKDLSPMDDPEAPQPIDIAQSTSGPKDHSTRIRLRKQKSWSSEIDHDEAWERKKDRLSVDSSTSSEELQKERKIGRSVSDCCHRIGSSHQGILRTRSLTDEDLAELRGCIDLGFGFSNQADPKLWNTFPALELCYAISQQLKDEQSRSSPVSILDYDILDASTTVDTAISSPAAASLMISSPGDHPLVVKERLRHWAQAVACTVRQSY